MSNTAEKNMQQTTNFMRSIGDFLKQFFQMLAQYLEENARTSAQKAIAQYIRDGGNLMAYSIQGDKIRGTIEELKNELDRKDLPFIALNGQREVILIRPEDYEQIREVNRETLIAKGNYFQEVDADKMENAIWKAPFIKDKEILTVHGLDKYEAEVLKNKCNHISAGFMIGTREEGEDKQSLSVHTRNIYSKDAKKEDFCKAYLEAQLSLYGPNHSIKESQIDIDEQMDAKVASLKGTSTPHYIVGAFDRSKYIELNEERFEFHRHIKTEDGQMMDKVESCPISDPDYEMELQRAMDRIYDRGIVTDVNALNKHLSGEKDVVENERPRRTKQQNQCSRAEHATAEKINTMIKERLENSDPPFSYSSCQEAFDRYRVEAAQIIDAVVMGKSLEGYKDQDLQGIRDIFEKKNIDLENYAEIPARLRGKEVEAHKAKPEPEKAKEPQGKEKEERDR